MTKQDLVNLKVCIQTLVKNLSFLGLCNAAGVRKQVERKLLFLTFLIVSEEFPTS